MAFTSTITEYNNVYIQGEKKVNCDLIAMFEHHMIVLDTERTL